MNSLVLIFCLLFLCGCAETRIYSNGQLACVIQADATNVTFKDHGVYFHADTLTHSTATHAAYTGAGSVVGALGTAAALAAKAIP